MDLRTFAIVLEADLKQRFTGKECNRRPRNTVDDEEISRLVAKELTNAGKHTVIVIDEVDHFNSSQVGFTTLIKTILT